MARDGAGGAGDCEPVVMAPKSVKSRHCRRCKRGDFTHGVFIHTLYYEEDDPTTKTFLCDECAIESGFCADCFKYIGDGYRGTNLCRDCYRYRQP